MGIQGQLTKSAFGYSVPVDEPLYTPFPVYYDDVTMLVFPYVTSAEAAAKLLPDQFELAPVPGDTEGKWAGAMLMFARYGFSSIGPYNEVAQVVSARYRNPVPSGISADVGFAVRLHVDSGVAMAFGREVGGFPKKMGHITVESSPEYVAALESPPGLRVCSGELMPIAPVAELTAPNVLPFASVRVLPNPASATPPFSPSLCQIVYTEWVQTQGTFWGARGHLCLTGASALNPYHALPIIQPAAPRRSLNDSGTALFRGRMEISRVVVLEDF
jgi:acetoacetate decarboxylase